VHDHPSEDHGFALIAFRSPLQIREGDPFLNIPEVPPRNRAAADYGAEQHHCDYQDAGGLQVQTPPID